MMMAKVDWNNVGFADGLRNLVEDWKLWMDVRDIEYTKQQLYLEGACDVARERKVVAEKDLSENCECEGCGKTKSTYKIGDGRIKEY